MNMISWVAHLKSCYGDCNDGKLPNPAALLPKKPKKPNVKDVLKELEKVLRNLPKPKSKAA